MREVLDSRRKGPDGQDFGPDHFVFGNECGEPIKRVRHAWNNTRRRAGIKDLNIHDLRREFGSRLAPRSCTTSATGSATPTWRSRAGT